MPGVKQIHPRLEVFNNEDGRGIIVRNNCPGLVNLKSLEKAEPSLNIFVEEVSFREDLVYGSEWTKEELVDWVRSLAHSSVEVVWVDYKNEKEEKEGFFPDLGFLGVMFFLFVSILFGNVLCLLGLSLFDMPPFSTVSNRVEVIFEGEKPNVR